VKNTVCTDIFIEWSTGRSFFLRHLVTKKPVVTDRAVRLHTLR